ncbi:partner of Y14 and mago [Lycorma delicatula]|uniref:partner of Y14 and mago n=1 Tax=Lycorma delicatula TaxID=130591 RepID=UPI003F50E1BE
MASTIVKDNEGSFIPATQRPDGSWRKARRVKDGYVPQEEVPLYESKGKQWANKKPLYPVGLDPDIIKKKEIELAKKNNTMYCPIPGLIIDPNSEVKKKKKKKKKNGGNSNSGFDEDKDGADSIVTNNNNNVASSKNQQKQSPTASTSSQQSKGKQQNKSSSSSIISTAIVDPVKKIKSLKKKLREIEALEQKVAKGDTKSLDKDQLDKISRKSEILSEILALELSLDNCE